MCVCFQVLRCSNMPTTIISMAKLQGAIPATTHQLPRMVCGGREVQGLHEGGVPSEDLQDVARLNGPNVDGILATCKILASCGQF